MSKSLHESEDTLNTFWWCHIKPVDQHCLWEKKTLGNKLNTLSAEIRHGYRLMNGLPIRRAVHGQQEERLTRTVEGGVMSGLLEHPDSDGA